LSASEPETKQNRNAGKYIDQCMTFIVDIFPAVSIVKGYLRVTLSFWDYLKDHFLA